MPKFSLKRRHQRQHDLSLCWQECTGESLARTTARLVSDDDIQLSPDEPQASNACDSSTSLYANERGLKRQRLSDLRQLLVESNFSCLSPTREDSQKQLQVNQRSETSSPWGHFVDLVIPSSPSDEMWNDSGEEEQSQSRFLPFCPSPEPSKRVSRLVNHHPYKHKQRSRRHLSSSRSTANEDINQFVLCLPNEPDTNNMLIEETQGALAGLHF